MPIDDADEIKEGTYHLLDMGSTKYGDCILAVFGATTILIDGGHLGDWRDRDGIEGIPTQLARIVNGPPFAVDLLVVTHCHGDHIGCLPRLVEDGTLTARWALVADERLGYGRDQDGRMDALDTASPEVRGLVAAILEEDHSDLSDEALARFLADAAKQEDTYREMLEVLTGQGTQIIRWGRSKSAEVEALLAEFADTGMAILGPTKDHLVLCAEQIQQFSQDAVEAITTAKSRDAAMSDTELYRAIIREGAFVDQLDMYGEGSAKNCQSIVLAFGPPGQKALLAADMQFGKPEVDDLEPEMEQLKQGIAAAGPFAFVKLTHHTSYNGVDETLLDALGSPKLLAHSGGWNDARHPDRDSLRMLKRIDQRENILFARTDRNGLITVDPSRTGVTAMRVSRGNLDDFSPNQEADTEGPRAEPGGGGSSEERRGSRLGVSAAEGPTESSAVELLFVRIPYEDGRVTLDGFEVEISGRGGPSRKHVMERATSPAHESKEPIAARSRAAGDRSKRPERRSTDERRLAGGRPLPGVVFVTDPDGLARNIGRSEAAEVLAMIERGGAETLAVKTASAVDATLSRLERGDVAGVVLLGGYDIIPAQRVDVLDERLRATISKAKISREPDAFVVWSDDAYVDIGREGMPDLPVSRIPDGRTASVVRNALAAPSPRAAGRFGIRNSARPFAAEVFEALQGSEEMLESGPADREALEPDSVRRPWIYFMLHGDHADGSRFWGEDDGLVEAVHVADLPSDQICVVLAGACWGALTVLERASRSNGYVSPKTPEQSMALTLLQAGATAFVGCTGAHYSPDESGAFFGGPMHRAFWAELRQGKPPARALFDAKVDYLRDMPHGLETPIEIAIERKIYKQFTCLGLGW